MGCGAGWGWGAGAGSKKKLLLLLCLVTGVLSAFLDNVTTILLISPVTIKVAGGGGGGGGGGSDCVWLRWQSWPVAAAESGHVY